MSLFESLFKRSQGKCELCSSQNILEVYEVSFSSQVGEEAALLICQTCRDQIENVNSMDVNHWRCLNESIWSEFESVKVMSYRLLSRFNGEAWATDLLDQLYLDDSTLEWAEAGVPQENETNDIKPTFDSNGVKLVDGDSVTLIKDLDVKGGGFTAIKRYIG